MRIIYKRPKALRPIKITVPVAKAANTIAFLIMMRCDMISIKDNK